MLSARRKREHRKETFDASHRTHPESPFKAGDIVLLHDTILDANMSVKLYYKWIGPYRIRTVTPGRGIYTLEELDGTIRTGTISGNRIKHFCQQHSNPIETYDTPPIVNDTLSMVEDAIY